MSHPPFNVQAAGDSVMGFLAIDSLLTAIVAVAIVCIVLLGNELYFRSYRKRNNLPERPPGH